MGRGGSQGAGSARAGEGASAGRVGSARGRVDADIHSRQCIAAEQVGAGSRWDGGTCVSVPGVRVDGT